MSHSCDSTYDIYSERFVRARKQHTCDACKRAIEAGAYYCKVFTLCKDYDSVHSYKRCGSCQRTHEHLRGLCHGVKDEPMWPDERLGCGLDYAEEWGGPPPDEIAALPLLTDAEAGQLLAPKVTP